MSTHTETESQRMTTLLTGILFQAIEQPVMAALEKPVTILAVDPSGEIRLGLASGRVARVWVMVDDEPEVTVNVVNDVNVIAPEVTA